MDEDGMRICVICKKIFPDDEGLIKHNREQHPQLNSVDNCGSKMSNPFKNRSLTITRVNGESGKRGAMNQNQNPVVRKQPIAGSASQSINVRRAEMKIMKQADMKAKAPFRSPSGQAGNGTVEVGNDNVTKWVQRDTVQREHLTNVSDGSVIITPSLAERATSAFCNSTAELTPRGKVAGRGGQSVNVARKTVPRLIPMVPNNGKRSVPGTSQPGGIRGANNSSVPDIMQTLGKIKTMNQQAQVRPGAKMISLPGGVSSNPVKKASATASTTISKQIQTPPFHMGKPPQVSKSKGKILPRNAYNNALPKPDASRPPPSLQLDEDMDFDDSLSEEDLYSPQELMNQQGTGKKSVPSQPAKQNASKSNGSGKAPPQKTLSANRFNPITAKKSPPPTPSRNGNASTSSKPLLQGEKAESASKSGSSLSNGTKSSQNKQNSEPVVVAKKSVPRVSSQEDKMKKMKLYIPTMPGTNYEMPSLSAVGSYTNRNGQQVWICLVCNEKEHEESSRDMICCDTCEDWYHWGCVGIFSSVNEDDPWYCKRCIFQASRNPRKDFPKLFKSNVPP